MKGREMDKFMKKTIKDNSAWISELIETNIALQAENERMKSTLKTMEVILSRIYSANALEQNLLQQCRDTLKGGEE